MLVASLIRQMQFTVVISSTLVYHSLKLASTVGLSVFSLPEELRTAAHKSNLRVAFDRYMTRSGHLRGWARFTLALAFLAYLTAAGLDKASTVTLAGGIVIAATLGGGTLLTIMGVRELSFEYRRSSNALKSIRVDFEASLMANEVNANQGESRAGDDKKGTTTPARTFPSPGVAGDTVIDVAAGAPSSPE